MGLKRDEEGSHSGLLKKKNLEGPAGFGDVLIGLAYSCSCVYLGFTVLDSTPVLNVMQLRIGETLFVRSAAVYLGARNALTRKS